MCYDGLFYTKKGYLLYSLRKFIVHRDVVFKEQIFPFSNSTSQHVPLFVAPPIPDYDAVPVHHTPASIDDQEVIPDFATTDAYEPDKRSDTNDGNAIVDQYASVGNQLSNVGVRTSTRRSHQPIRMKDYVTNMSESICPLSLAKHVSYDHLSSRYQAYLSHMSATIEPKSYEEAIKDHKWVEAMQQEIAALEDNASWTVMELPPGKKAIGCRWVCKIKYYADGQVERYKARLVSKGYSQTEGIDYHGTFSPMVKMVTVRTLLQLQKLDIG